MLSNILIFILFLGPLVFFHELGHFLFARLFGVKVEVFSIGFGPKILKFKKGDTEYAISIIPLGGYVKMFGDDPMKKDEIALEEREISFTHKSKWARFWIVFGGPLANFIFAYFIFSSLLLTGEKVPEIKLGKVTEKSVLYEKGFRTADVLLKANGNKIMNPSDIGMDSSNSISTITVKRQGGAAQLSVDLKVEEFFKELSNHPPILRRPFLIHRSGKKYALSLDKSSVDLTMSLEEFKEKLGRQELFLHEISATSDLKAEKIDYLSSFAISIDNTGENFEKELLKNELRLIDLAIDKFSKDSAAKASGLLENDIITSLNGTLVYNFSQLKSALQASKEEVQKVTFWRGDKELTIDLKPKFINEDGKIRKLLGVYSSSVIQAPQYITTESKGFLEAFILGFSRTYDGIIKVINGFKKLITGEVSVKNIGGPLAIGKVAADSYNSSLTFFFQLMAFISINLGVINLFPIPVLDGGHIMFLGLEILNRGPLSRRKMEIAQQVGLSLLLMLMFGAIFNDVKRFLF